MTVLASVACNWTRPSSVREALTFKLAVLLIAVIKAPAVLERAAVKVAVVVPSLTVMVSVVESKVVAEDVVKPATVP